VRSIKVVVPNRPGLLAEVTEVLAARSISIDHIVVETHGAGAVVRMALESDDDALDVLNRAGYHALSDDVLLARLDDKPGALAQLSRRLGEANVNIRSMHHVQRDGGQALVAVSTDDNARARELLGDIVL
jgi:hypothetical protein